MKLNKQLKGQKKTEAKELAHAYVTFEFHNYNSTSRLPGAFLHALNEDGFNNDLILALEQALKDVEALKAIKPSVSW